MRVLLERLLAVVVRYTDPLEESLGFLATGFRRRQVHTPWRASITLKKINDQFY